MVPFGVGQLYLSYFQGNVAKATGCTPEMIQHYNYLTDKTFRLGNSRSACCDWDLCNLTWETANMTQEQYQQLKQDQVFEVTISIKRISKFRD